MNTTLEALLDAHQRHVWELHQMIAEIYDSSLRHEQAMREHFQREYRSRWPVTHSNGTPDPF